MYERLLENFVLEGEGQNDMTSHTIDAELRSWYAELEETTSGPPAETSAARGGAVNGVEESRRLEFVPAFTSTEDFLCPSTSLASRLVESTPIEQRTIPFAEYAKFEAIGVNLKFNE